MTANIKVFIDNDQLVELRKSCDFLEVQHYCCHDLAQPGEVGSIEFLSGQTLRFFIRQKGINPQVLLTILEEIYNMADKQPMHALNKLPQVIKFLKENT